MNYKKSLNRYYTTMPTFKSIMSDELVSGMDYQRSIKNKHVAEIANNFNPILFEPPVVVYYDGKNHLVEGQHRVSGLVMLNGGKPTPVMCRVHSGEYEDGAFVIENHDKNRLRQTQYQTITAAAKRGDEAARRFVEANRVIGIRMVGTEETGEFYFQAAGTMFSMLKKYGVNTYIRVMTMFCATFGNKQETHDARFIKAVFAFDSKYQKKYKASIFQKRMKDADVQKMIANARTNNYAMTDGLIYAIVPMYNRGISEELKL